MKKFVVLSVVVIALAISSHATVWRINNITGADADFTSPQTAHNTQYVFAGDTLYIEPSTASYGDLTLTKKLVIIGNGYWPAQNMETQANINNSVFGNVSFNPGSQGSIIQGCHIFHIVLKTSEILIERNFVHYEGASGSIDFGSDYLSNIIIRNNYLKNSWNAGAVYGSCQVIYCGRSGIYNVIISNNFIESATHDKSNITALLLVGGFTGVVENNVIYGRNLVYNSQFNNNILRDGTWDFSNTTYYNNLSNSDQFGTEYGNKSNVNMLNVFVNEGSTDGQWQLKAGSPAIGAGVGGIDCGVFGGDFPYVLSGIPAIPSVYEFSYDIDYENQQIEVEISVKSHN